VHVTPSHHTHTHTHTHRNGCGESVGAIVHIPKEYIRKEYWKFQTRVNHYVRVCKIPIKYDLDLWQSKYTYDILEKEQIHVKGGLIVGISMMVHFAWGSLLSHGLKRKKEEYPWLFRKQGLLREVLPERFDKLMMKKTCRYTHENIEDPTLCLICGDILCSRKCTECCNVVSGVGPVTEHVLKKHGGCGVVLRISSSDILIFRGAFCASYPSLYVDAYGEEDRGLRRGKPLILSSDRFNALDKLYRAKGIAQEVTKIRSHSDRVFRANVF